jgi:hypothetical protein
MDNDLHLLAGDAILNDAGLWVAMRYTSLPRETARALAQPDGVMGRFETEGITADMPRFSTIWQGGRGRIHDLRSHAP